MTQPITVIAHFKIHEGKQDEWRALYEKGMKEVAANEPEVINFSMYANDDESVFASYEVYESSEAIIEHFKLAEERISGILAASDVISVEVYGDASSELKELLQPYGTKIFNYDRGYSR